MTTDREFLGKGNIDRFDALYFHAFYVNTNDKGKKQDLIVSFFETVAMATPTKSQNPTVLGLRGPGSTQWSTIAGFANGTLGLATITTLHLTLKGAGFLVS